MFVVSESGSLFNVDGFLWKNAVYLLALCYEEWELVQSLRIFSYYVLIDVNPQSILILEDLVLVFCHADIWIFSTYPVLLISLVSDLKLLYYLQILFTCFHLYAILPL